MGELTGLERRLRSHGPSSLIDEALAISRALPSLYLAALPGAMLLGAVAAAFVLLHRGLWAPLPAVELLPYRTPMAALAVALAYAVRGVGHGEVARRLARIAGREVARPRRPLALATLALVVPTLVLPGTALLLGPGLFLAGRLAPLPGLVAVEGRDAGAALASGWTRARSEAWLGAGAHLVLLALGLAVLGNLLLGSFLGVQALRMLTGADVTGLSRLASPLNEGFLLGTVVVTAVVVDPVLALVRALLYLRITSEETAGGLERRWRERLAGAGGTAAALLLAGATLCLPGRAAAEDVPSPNEPVQLTDWVRNADIAAGRLRSLAEGWEGSETLALAPLAPVLGESLRGPVRLRGGLLRTAPETLLAGLPERIDSDESAEAVLGIARRVELASAEAALLLAPVEGAPPAARALADELAEGRYRLARDARGTARVRRQGLKDRLLDWWDGLFDEAPDSIEPHLAEPPGSASRITVGAIAAGVVAAVVGVLGVLLRAMSSPSGGAAGRGSTHTQVHRSAHPRLAPERWLERADDSASSGDYPEAVRLVWLGVLAAQDAAGALESSPGLTNGEHARAWNGPAGSAPRFHRVAVRVDALRYGREAADRGAWLDLRADCAPLLEDAQ